MIEPETLEALLDILDLVERGADADLNSFDVQQVRDRLKPGATYRDSDGWVERGELAGRTAGEVYGGGWYWYESMFRKGTGSWHLIDGGILT